MLHPLAFLLLLVLSPHIRFLDTYLKSDFSDSETLLKVKKIKTIIKLKSHHFPLFGFIILCVTVRDFFNFYSLALLWCVCVKIKCTKPKKA